MGSNHFFHILIFSLIFLISKTHELQTTQSLILLQLRKHLEYPIQLTNWENYNGDFCYFPTNFRVTIKCEDNSITELKIMGDKLPKVSLFHGLPLRNQTLSESFSIDSFVVTLTRLTTLKVLSLVSLGLWGQLPDKIHRLNSLEVLDMSSNFIFGFVPNGISRLQKLQSLTLDGNFFNESLPDHLFNTLSNLTILSLKNNKLKGHFPSSISKLTTITEIVLSHNNLSGKLPDLTTLSNLHLLDLRNNHLESNLPSFPKGVITILLSNNSFSGTIPEEFGKLNRLHHLDVSSNKLSGTPPSSLFLLQNITYLNLACNMLSGSLPSSIKCGNKLGFVDISSNRFTGRLPACLDIVSSNKRVVKFTGNCLLVGHGNGQESDCKEGSVIKKPYWGKVLWVLIVVICSSMCLISFVIVVLIFRKRRRLRKTVTLQHTIPKASDNSAPSEIACDTRIVSDTLELGTQVSTSCRVFTMKDLVEATGNFDQSTFLGEGSIGKIYKGRLENGSYVAIRSLSLFKRHSKRNLKVRLDLIAKLQHPHLVSFLGYCINDGGVDNSTSSRIFLVYEYVSNGNFRAFLSENGSERIFKWSDRLAVLIGVAKAVHFLHSGVIPASSSNRLKTNNVLLDDYGIAKLSDYGMSVITGELEQLEAKGEGSKSWRLKKLADDVYDFGFILLEALVGSVVSGKGEAFLLNEMNSFGSQDGRQRIVDPIVLTTCSQESLSIVISITNKCISPEPTNRPSFEDVLWNLQYAAQVQTTTDVDYKSSDGASQFEL
ncbi:hypothetical protein QVD17_06997 [Tagetes erecta]|uniref:Protein kinase domain-containing protein n=1 Tax=Tagetes erecta TaxID=13708 RepID=A0AAD8LKI1_TARER|nr:hypothetical protein QVD17_06997 [Tagetes erecta]